MRTEIILSQTDSRPMYRQIMDEIQRRVALGDWAPGMRLPSIRELASELQVSVITVKRAYRELERDAVIVTRQGLGSFVRADVDAGDVQEEELERHLRRVGKLAAELGLSLEELVSLVEKYALQSRSLKP